MFLATSLTLAPGRQHTFLWDGSKRHIGPSVPLRRESPMTTALLFILTDDGAKRGADWLALGNLSCMMDMHQHPHPPVPSAPEPHTCSVRAPGKVGQAEGLSACCPKQGLVSIPCCLQGRPFPPDCERADDPPLLEEHLPHALPVGMVECNSTNQYPLHNPRYRFPAIAGDLSWRHQSFNPICNS